MIAQIAVQGKENTFRNKFKAYLKIIEKIKTFKENAYTAVAIKMARVVHAITKQQADSKLL